MSPFSYEEISEEEVLARKMKGYWYVILGLGLECRVKCVLRIGKYCGNGWTYPRDSSQGVIVGCGWVIEKWKDKFYFQHYKEV